MNGSLNSLRTKLSAILGKFMRMGRFSILEKNVSEAYSTQAAAKIDVTIRIAQFSDLSRISDMPEFNAREMLKIGNICVVGELRDGIVHWSWVAFNDAYISEIGRKIHICADSAYIYAVYTVPEYRGLGIAPKAFEKICSYLHEKGIKKSYICIAQDNFPSLKVAHKAGFQEIGTVTFIKVGKLKFYRFKGETERDYVTIRKMFSVEKTV